MNTVDKIRARCAKRAAALLLTVPALLPTLVHGSLPPEPQLVAQAREMADLAQADRFELTFQNGLFVGWGIMKMMRGGGLPTYLLTIAANTYNYDVGTAAALLGYDNTKPAKVWVTVNSGIFVGNQIVTDGYVSMTWSIFPAGSDCKLINTGYIVGRGGAGGNGGSPGGNGESGQRALALSGIPSGLVIDNSSGYIFGGGGGGGGGGGSFAGGNAGGGGGGQGYNGGGGGSGAGVGTAGSAGDSSSHGSGGSGGPDAGGDGGNGGLWAEAGTAGGPGTFGGGGGGDGGVAVYTNSNPVTWLGGNDATHLKGGVV
jgi:hypothetical protein